MLEERTQPPSKRRRQQARQHGQVAHSPELTAAAGWLAAVLLIGSLQRKSGTRLQPVGPGVVRRRGRTCRPIRPTLLPACAERSCSSSGRWD